MCQDRSAEQNLGTLAAAWDPFGGTLDFDSIIELFASQKARKVPPFYPHIWNDFLVW